MSVVSYTQQAQALRRAAVRATLAPSVHNVQPWRLVLSASALEIHVDRSRQLPVVDPTRRQLILSCGCALFNARVSLAANGYEAEVERFPDPDRSDLLARVRLPGSPTSNLLPLSRLDEVIELRHTNRRTFTADPVPDDLVASLVAAAEHEDAELIQVQAPEQRRVVAAWWQQAEQQHADPASRSALRAWTTADPVRGLDTDGIGELSVQEVEGAPQCLLLLGSTQDKPAAWLRAGEALEHVLLEVTRSGFAATPYPQPMDLRRTRMAMRDELGLQMYPHLLMRVGRAPATPASRRRRLVDVLSIRS